MAIDQETLNRVETEIERLALAIADLRWVELEAPSYSHPRQTGAIRRASMDLTRALADLRRAP